MYHPSKGEGKNRHSPHEAKATQTKQTNKEYAVGKKLEQSGGQQVNFVRKALLVV